jgi:hypothetical protein
MNHALKKYFLQKSLSMINLLKISNPHALSLAFIFTLGLFVIFIFCMLSYVKCVKTSKSVSHICMCHKGGGLGEI